MDDTSSKTRILDTAARLFGEYGKAAVTTARIAREAGINKAMIFYYFGSKDELYDEAAKKWLGGLFESIKERIDGVEPGLPTIETFVRAHVAYLIEHPALVKLIVRELLVWGEDPPPPIAGFLRNLGGIRARMIDTFHIAVQRGEIRPVDPIHTMLNIISMDIFVFVGNPIIHALFSEVDMQRIIDERADHILDLLMNGLRPRQE
jgi:TetR/AcrR family transcriptional regulator